MDIDREAEQATIGAILLEPGRYEDVREWLEPEDFDGLRERAAYAAIVDIASDERMPTPDAVHRYLRDAVSRDDSPLQPDGVLLADCIHVCPVPARAATNGRMVLELSIRRQIATGAAALQQRAESASTSDDLTIVFARVDILRRDVEDLHERQARADNALSPTPLLISGLGSAPASREVSNIVLERQFVVGLVERPRALDIVGRWLRADDFSDDAAATVYHHLIEMRETGVSIDRLTLGWSLTHSDGGAQAFRRIVPSAQLGAASADPVVDAREVLRSSVAGAVTSTAAGAREAATQTTGRDTDITAVAYQRLNDLWPAQRRLVTAHHARESAEQAQALPQVDGTGRGMSFDGM